MDRFTPQEPSTPNTEVQTHEQPHLLKRALNATGEFFKENKNKLTAAAVGGVLAITLAGCGTTAKAEGPSHETTSSAEATPKKTTTPEKEYTVESLAVPSSLSPEDAVKTIIGDRIPAWNNAGKSDAFADKAFAEGRKEAGGTDKVEQETATQLGDVFKEALFIANPDANDAASLNIIAQREEAINHNTLDLWIKTYHPDPADAQDYPEDKAAYERSMTVDDGSIVIQPQADGSIVANFKGTEHDNSDQNRAAQLSQGTSAVNGNQFEGTVSLVKVDNTWKVKNLSINDAE